jgi:hypothetical protein
VHRSEGSNQLALSSATRSRFTEIDVAPYSPDELQAVLQFELARQLMMRGMGSGDAEAVQCRRALFQAYSSLLSQQRGASKGKCEPHHLLRCVDFLANHDTDLPLLNRLLLAIKVFLVEPLQVPAQLAWADRFWRDFRASERQAYSDADSALVCSLFEEPTDTQCCKLFEIVSVPPGSGLGAPTLVPRLRCVYTGVSAAPRGMLENTRTGAGAGLGDAGSPVGELSLEGIAARMQCAPTRTFVKNVARIFAASKLVLWSVVCDHDAVTGKRPVLSES